MNKSISSKILFYAGAVAASLMMIFNVGCASGGFKLTREYAGFVNRQDLIIRIILYIFTGVVFAVTLLVDFVINNTMDFWQGRVSQGTYEFKQGDKTYVARHEILPSNGLRRSTIEVLAASGERIQQVILSETPNRQIEVYIDGSLKMRVKNINDIPLATTYDALGAVLKSETVPLSEPTLLSAF